MARSSAAQVTIVTLSNRVKSLTSSNQHPPEEVSILQPMEIEEEKQSELSVESAKANLKGDSGQKKQREVKDEVPPINPSTRKSTQEQETRHNSVQDTRIERYTIS